MSDILFNIKIKQSIIFFNVDNSNVFENVSAIEYWKKFNIYKQTPNNPFKYSNVTFIDLPPTQ